MRNTAAVFRCPTCRFPLAVEPPNEPCAKCGHTIPHEGRILILTDDPVVRDGDDGWYGYDRIAQSYDKLQDPPELERQIHEARAERFAALVPEGGRVLNVGCGSGRLDVVLARRIAPRGGQVYSGDISIEMLRLLVARASDLPPDALIPCRLNALDLPFEDASFDLVVEFMTLFLLHDVDLAIAEIRRVLLRDGAFALQSATTTTERTGEDPKVCAMQAYRVGLSELGVSEPPEPCSTSEFRRKWQEGMARSFTRRETLEGPDLVYRYTESLGWAFDRIAAGYTMLHVVLDDETRTSATRRANGNLTRMYGIAYRQIMSNVIEHDRIDLWWP